MRWSLLLVAVACTHTPAPTVTKETPTSPDLDVLFMIDNSAQIADKQTVFASDFPALVAAFDQFPGGRPNLHVGVVDSTVDIGNVEPLTGPNTECPSPNMIDDGRLQNTARVTGCTPPDGRFFVDIANPDGTRTTNYTGSLDQALACIAQVGAAGCGYESQLLAIERAVDGTNPENAGFLRPDADLAIVILTDEDDCSIVDPTLLGLPADTVGGLNDFRCQPMFAYDCDRPITAGSGTETYTNCLPHPGGYLRDLDALYKALAKIKDPSQISVSLIAGDPESTIMTGALQFGGGLQDPALFPSCRATVNGNPALARPGIRLQAFADRYAPNSSFASVCQSDYTQALVAAEATMTSMMTSPCLDGSVDATDTDATNPGLQPACTVVDQLDFGQPDQSTLTVPACPMIGATLPDPNGPRPCWWAAVDDSCQPPSELAMHVERDTPSPLGTVVAESCAQTR